MRIALTGFLLVAWIWSAQQSKQLKSHQLHVGGRAGAVAVADLNRDRKLDIVGARIDAGTLSVFLGDGRGGYTQAPGSPFAAGSSPEDLALADFNEDGNVDVAVANHETNYLTLLLGDGKGALVPASPSRVPVSSRPHPHGVTAKDFNEDGHPDLAVESRDENAVLILHGNGQGGFATEPKRLTVGRGPYWKLRSADLNNDGKNDVVTTDNQGSSVSVLLAGGRAEFQTARQIATAMAPFAIAIGDVNADRYPDLAIVHRRGDSNPALDGLTVLLGTPNGAFVAAPRSPWNHGVSPTAVAIGDFDGDQVGDIAVANMQSNDVTILHGSRSGSKGGKTSRYAVGQAPTAIAVGDLNSDGKTDIVTGNWGSGDVSVLLSP
jgi:hypothetical protein